MNDIQRIEEEYRQRAIDDLRGRHCRLAHDAGQQIGLLLLGEYLTRWPDGSRLFELEVLVRRLLEAPSSAVQADAECAIATWFNDAGVNGAVFVNGLKHAAMAFTGLLKRRAGKDPA